MVEWIELWGAGFVLSLPIMWAICFEESYTDWSLTIFSSALWFISWPLLLINLPIELITKWLANRF